jgi:hypothetical protein
VDISNAKDKTWSREMATGSVDGAFKRYGAGMIAVCDGSLAGSFRYMIIGGNSGSRILSTHSLGLTFDMTKDAVFASKGTARYLSYLFPHGNFLWVAYGVLMPTGIFASRYMRTLSTSPRWFHIHIIAQSLAAISVWAGIVFAITNARGSPAHLHATVGIILIGLMTIQIIGGLPGIRLHPNAGIARKIRSTLHHSVG